MSWPTSPRSLAQSRLFAPPVRRPRSPRGPVHSPSIHRDPSANPINPHGCLARAVSISASRGLSVSFPSSRRKGRSTRDLASPRRHSRMPGAPNGPRRAPLSALAALPYAFPRSRRRSPRSLGAGADGARSSAPLCRRRRATLPQDAFSTPQGHNPPSRERRPPMAASRKSAPKPQSQHPARKPIQIAWPAPVTPKHETGSPAPPHIANPRGRK
jgi:hypothetical protein